MATTINELAAYLYSWGWHYETYPERDLVLTGVLMPTGEKYPILLILTQNGRFLQMVIPQFLNLKEHVYKGIAFQTLLNISFELKMIRFEYDLSNGEVRASVELPLEDAPLTAQQFNYALEGLVKVVDGEAKPRLKAVLSTGEDPGNKRRLQNLLSMMPREAIAEVEQIVKKYLPE